MQHQTTSLFTTASMADEKLPLPEREKTDLELRSREIWEFPKSMLRFVRSRVAKMHTIVEQVCRFFYPHFSRNFMYPMFSSHNIVIVDMCTHHNFQPTCHL